jgi:hypothetical protein
MASQGTGEVDDFPENARTLSNNSNLSGNLPMRTDEDFFKFTAAGNRAVISFSPTNTNMIADLYVQSGSAINYIGYLPEAGMYPVSTSAGATYYIQVKHSNNKVFGLTSNYTLGINSFTCSETIAAILGRQSNGSRIAYITNSENLYVNSTLVLTNYFQKLRHDYQDPVSDPRQGKHTSHAVSPVSHAVFISYNTTRPDVDSMSDALALVIRNNNNDGGVYYENRKNSFATGYPNPVFDNGYTYFPFSTIPAAYIVNLADNQVKDLASIVGNGFYNFFFGNYSYTITAK